MTKPEVWLRLYLEFLTWDGEDTDSAAKLADVAMKYFDARWRL